MAKAGKKELVVPTVPWKYRCPVDVAAKVESYLFDPVRQKVEYGARSDLITMLLRAWLASREKHPPVAELAPSAHNNDSSSSGEPS